MWYKEGVLNGIDIPPFWKVLRPDHLRGLVMVIGAPDSGKSTFCRYLYSQLLVHQRPCAYLDGDPGQSFLGPPTTLSLAIGDLKQPTQVWRRFVASISPRGNMLSMLTAVSRLMRKGFRQNAEVIVYDTDGLVDPLQGGIYYKFALIELLAPQAICFLSLENELQPLLNYFQRQNRHTVYHFYASSAVQPRSPDVRRQYRTAQFAAYFSSARQIEIDWREMPIWPAPRFFPNQLLALTDREGYCLSLAILLDHHVEAKRLQLLTPLSGIESIAGIHLSRLALDPQTFQTHLFAADTVSKED
ncbi:MAG: Clp1/GlmU family protein [Anaerolineales bacterium]|nr:Clp1/GlmU family protein [Anaerolineales bacterium]MDW8161466.1 Clp1/GlmU family protein [Anaerolineales bacterium]